MDKLLYLSEKSLEQLRSDISKNTQRYIDGDFLDMKDDPSWSISLSISADLSAFDNLDDSGGPEAEIKNSIIVWEALEGLTPSLACEERLWARLTHIEGLEYSRNRWLKNKDKASIPKLVEDHFFANTRTKWRDDNAISRLWWNAYIAKRALPGNQKSALEALLWKADIRSNLVERTGTLTRSKLAAGIIRIMISDPWPTAKEQNFREFMKTVNKYGGGYIFEVMDDMDVDKFISDCCSKAKAA